jgi:hypothetical protein
LVEGLDAHLGDEDLNGGASGERDGAGVAELDPDVGEVLAAALVDARVRGDDLEIRGGGAVVLRDVAGAEVVKALPVLRGLERDGAVIVYVCDVMGVVA